ncbi:MAG: ATP-dependent helicase/nuclease subunit A [Phycisphaerae bacterium]|nr:ATP-dependent helicase/nuclease subunit A [Phycisphaerae bacterium]
MILTPSQRCAVEHRAESLLVSASAGSGKTEVMAQRCLWLITQAAPACDIDRLLVVTFTRAAAAELRARIARRLHGLAADTSAGAARDRLRRQAVLVDVADICTFDSWCGRLVREHFAAAGVDPAFRTLSPEEAALLRHQTLDALLDGIYRGSETASENALNLLARNAHTGDAFLRQWIQSIDAWLDRVIEPEVWIAAALRTHEAPADERRRGAQHTLSAALVRELAFQSGQLAALPATQMRANPYVQTYARQIEDWRKALDDGGEDVMSIVKRFNACEFAPRGELKRASPLTVEIHDTWFVRRLQRAWDAEQVAEIVQDAPDSSALASTALRLTVRYRELLTQRKRQRGALEFADVARRALAVLSDESPGGVASRLRDRYEHVLVDEYQDVSPLQTALLARVARTGHAANRFLVGDVKQSIYAFRSAEPRLFLEAQAALRAGGERGTVLTLADNFRSHPRLLETLNTLFGRLFSEAFGGSAFADGELLVARRTEVPNPSLDDSPRVDVHIIDESQPNSREEEEDDESDDLTERIDREAALAAEMIIGLRSEGVRVPRRAGDGVTLEPVRFSDVVILLRAAHVNAARIAAVLRDAGIPCLTAGRESLLRSVEVQDVRAVLALLASRRQDVPMAAYLRGPFVGLSAQELLDIRTAQPRGGFAEAAEHYATEGSDAALRARVQAGMSWLDELSREARLHELPTILRRIIHSSGYELFARGQRGGRHRAELLAALERYAGQFARTGLSGVHEFVEFLDDIAQRDLDLEAAVAAGEDAVRIMTIHAAKGLEFPFVFLLNAGAEFNNRRCSQAIQCDEAGLGLRFLDYPQRRTLTTPEHPVIGQRGVQREREEELRLLYVAATRAREKLTIIGHGSGEGAEGIRARAACFGDRPPLATLLGAKSHLEWVQWAVACGGCDRAAPPLVTVTTHAAGAIGGPDRSAAPEPPPAMTPDDAAWVARAEALVRAGVRRAASDLPAALSVSALKQSAEALHDEGRRVYGHAISLRRSRFDERAPASSPTAAGIAVHRFLQFADLAELDTVGRVAAQVAELVAARRLTLEEAALIEPDPIVWFACTPLGRRVAAQSGTARRELAFVYLLPGAAEAERVMARGVIDCLFEDEHGLCIVDYKTDRLKSEEELSARVAVYRTQVELYARAVAAVSGKPVGSASLVFFGPRRVVEVSLADEMGAAWATPLLTATTHVPALERVRIV